MRIRILFDIDGNIVFRQEAEDVCIVSDESSADDMVSNIYYVTDIFSHSGSIDLLRCIADQLPTGASMEIVNRYLEIDLSDLIEATCSSFYEYISTNVLAKFVRSTFSDYRYSTIDRTLYIPLSEFIIDPESGTTFDFSMSGELERFLDSFAILKGGENV